MKDELAKHTLEDPKQFRLTVIVALVSAFVLGLAVGVLTCISARVPR